MREGLERLLLLLLHNLVLHWLLGLVPLSLVTHFHGSLGLVSHLDLSHGIVVMQVTAPKDRLGLRHEVLVVVVVRDYKYSWTSSFLKRITALTQLVNLLDLKERLKHWYSLSQVGLPHVKGQDTAKLSSASFS